MNVEEVAVSQEEEFTVGDRAVDDIRGGELDAAAVRAARSWRGSRCSGIRRGRNA